MCLCKPTTINRISNISELSLQFSGKEIIMTTKKFIATLLLIVLLLLPGCQTRDETLDLAICGSYAVPGLFCYELKGGGFSCTVLETDRQGRILFSYTTQSIITGQEETAFVICQDTDLQYVYFYEDKCYSLGDPECVDLAQLKKDNDWDRPLDYEKMAKRSNAISADLFIIKGDNLEHKKVETACCVALGAQKEQIKELCFLDIDSAGHVLYWLVLNNEETTEEYVFIINKSYEAVYMNATNGAVYSSDFISFKKDNGWS